MLRHLPNLITALRILLIVPLCWLIDTARYDGALVIAAIAGLSDAVDGFIAKRYGCSRGSAAFSIRSRTSCC